MPTAQARQPGATILVADHDVIVRIALAEYLRNCGFRVIEAATSAEARTVIQHGPVVEVLMIDARLGGDNGFALAQWARLRNPRMAVILSANIAGKCDAAARMCSGGDRATSPGLHLRQRIEAMSMRGGRSARRVGGSRARMSLRRSA